MVQVCWCVFTLEQSPAFAFGMQNQARITALVFWFFQNTSFYYIISVCKTGYSNVSAKESLHIFNDKHVLFSDINSPRTFADIKENSQIAIVCLDTTTQIQRDGTELSSNYLMVSDSFTDDFYPEIMVAESINDIHIIKKKLSDEKERDLRQYYTISLLESKSYYLYQS
jgi:hypothetical protein